MRRVEIVARARARTARRIGHALVAALLGLGACSEEGVEGGERVAPDDRPAQYTTNLRVEETALGRRVWILEANEAVEDPETNVMQLTGVTLRFYDRDGELESTLTARTGEADRESRHMVSRGDVVVRTNEGYLLETEVLEWDNGRKKILSDEPVKITQGRNVYTGVGLISDPGLESFEILENFQGTVIDDAGDESGGTDAPD